MKSNEYNLIRKTLYGLETLVPENAIFTTISGIYHIIISSMTNKTENKNGWWQSMTGEFMDQDVIAVKIPQNTGVIDAALSLENTGSLLFIGYCGALNESFDLKDIIFADKAISQQCTSCPSIGSSLKKATVGTVKSFMEPQPAFFQKEIDCIDMETFYFLKAAKKVAKRYGSILAVSDFPFKAGSRFFELGQSHSRSLHEKLSNDLPDIIMSHLNAASMGA
jgi:nucleoside phosphorylase